MEVLFYELRSIGSRWNIVVVAIYYTKWSICCKCFYKVQPESLWKHNQQHPSLQRCSLHPEKNTTLQFFLGLSFHSAGISPGLCCLVYFGKSRMALEDSGGCFLWAEDTAAKEGRTISWLEFAINDVARGRRLTKPAAEAWDRSVVTMVTLISSICNCLPFFRLLRYKIFRRRLKAVLQTAQK